MNDFETTYQLIRNGGVGFHEESRGLIAVWGKEAVQFLDGLISNDMKTLAEGEQMFAAFPNAQGRLLAVVRVLKKGDRYLFETEEATREMVFNNLFRFTFAGDFYVEDRSRQFRYFELFGALTDHEVTETSFVNPHSTGIFVSLDQADIYRANVLSAGAVEISDELYEVLRIENGVPKYGVDMDEITIVPELGMSDLISYKKGCYIGQEIIARIYFRGHVAKSLTGLRLSGNAVAGTELTTLDGKNAGRITSVTFSPKLAQTVALAFVRYDHLAVGTKLLAGDVDAIVSELPFVK